MKPEQLICDVCKRVIHPMEVQVKAHFCIGQDMRQIDELPLAERLRWAADYSIPEWLKKT